jgi:hypothetical protein
MGSERSSSPLSSLRSTSRPPLPLPLPLPSPSSRTRASGSRIPIQRRPRQPYRQRLTAEEKIDKVFNLLRHELGWTIGEFIKALCSRRDAVNTRRKASLETVMYTDPEVLDCFLSPPNARNGVQKAVIDALNLGNNELRDEIHSLGDHKHFGRFAADGNTGFESLNMAELADVLQQHTPLTLQLLQSTTKSIHQQRERQNDFEPRFVLILAILCFSQRRNSALNFQTILGLYLHSKGVKRRQLDLLAQFGVTVSYQSIMRSIKQLSEKAAESVAETGCCSDDAVTAYDNFEQVEGVKEQRVEGNDRFHSVTTGEVIRGIDIPPGGLRQEMLDPRVELRAGDIFFASGNLQDTIEYQV